jgi:hypothetical protein
MPPHDRVRLNDAGQTQQARPPSGHPNHQDTVTCPKPDTSWGSPQGDVELMTQKKVLDFKIADRNDLSVLQPAREIPDGLFCFLPTGDDELRCVSRHIIGVKYLVSLLATTGFRGPIRVSRVCFFAKGTARLVNIAQ